MPSLKRSIHVGLVSAFYLTSPVVGDCTRELLTSAADLYVASQTAGSLTSIQPLLTSDWKYQENNKIISVTSGVISTALKMAHRKSTYDTVACASYTEFIATTPKPYVIGTQLRHTADGTQVTMIDIIAATTGALSFNAAKTLGYIEKEDWSPIPAGKETKREVLPAAADNYLDMWTNKTAYDAIPWGTPCERVEGSSLNSPCTVGAPKGGSSQRNSMRRCVIDETMGSCDIHCAFSAAGGKADSHEFRLENGKLRFVHTITLQGCSAGS